MTDDSSGLLPAFVRERYTARLGIALAFAIVVMVAFGAVIGGQASSELRTDVEGDLTTQASAQAAQLDTWVSAVEQSVRTTSQLPVFESGATNRIGQQLSAMVEGGSVPDDVVAVHYLDTERMRFLASSTPEMAGVSPRQQGAPFATEPPQFDGPAEVYISDPFSVPVVDHPIIAVLSPIEGTNDRALVYMTDLEARANALSASNSTDTVVVNADGDVLAHPNASRILESAELILQPGTATRTDFRRAGDTVMGIAPLQTQNWTVTAQVPADRAFALSEQINADLIGLVLLAIINLGVIGVTIGSNTALAVRRLAGRAKKMSDGDLDVDLSTDRDDEIGSLYKSYATMRDSLRETIADDLQALLERFDVDESANHTERQPAIATED